MSKQKNSKEEKEEKNNEFLGTAATAVAAALGVGFGIYALSNYLKNDNHAIEYLEEKKNDYHVIENLEDCRRIVSVLKKLLVPFT